MTYLEKAIVKSGGDLNLYRIDQYLTYDASREMRTNVQFHIGFDVFSAAVNNEQFCPRESIVGAIQRYLQAHPEEYHPVFESLFTAEELINMSQSLRGAA